MGGGIPAVEPKRQVRPHRRPAAAAGAVLPPVGHTSERLPFALAFNSPDGRGVTGWLCVEAGVL